MATIKIIMPMTFLVCLAFFLPVCIADQARYKNSEKLYVEQSEYSARTSRHIASDWGLNETDVARYRDIMRGRRGIWSPDIDPLLALGVEARDDDERKHYAELYVKSEYARTERDLAFQREVTLAWKRLYPAIPIVRTLPNKYASSLIPPKAERLAIFVAKDCQRCDSITKASIKRAKNAAVPLDIYLTDSHGDDSLLRHWAVSSGITAGQVRDGLITLNHIGADDPADAPAVYIKLKAMPWRREQ